VVVIVVVIVIVVVVVDGDAIGDVPDIRSHGRIARCCLARAALFGFLEGLSPDPPPRGV